MPEASHWHGLSKTGCLTRRVVDTALWLDVASGPAQGDAHTPPQPETSYVEAAGRSPGRLRVALSTSPARALAPAVITSEVVDAVERAGEVLKGLGHEVLEKDPDYGPVATNVVIAYLSGIAQHYNSVPHPERLEKKTRGFARMGRAIPPPIVRSAIDSMDKYQRRIGRIFDDVDVLITPTVGEPAVPMGKWADSGAFMTLLGMSRTYPFTPIWNYTGQPAAAVPMGFTDDGLPLSVMLISPPNREDLLISLAAQIEDALGWPDERPPVEFAAKP